MSDNEQIGPVGKFWIVPTWIRFYEPTERNFIVWNTKTLINKGFTNTLMRKAIWRGCRNYKAWTWGTIKMSESTQILPTPILTCHAKAWVRTKCELCCWCKYEGLLNLGSHASSRNVIFLETPPYGQRRKRKWCLLLKWNNTYNYHCWPQPVVPILARPENEWDHELHWKLMWQTEKWWTNSKERANENRVDNDTLFKIKPATAILRRWAIAWVAKDSKIRRRQVCYLHFHLIGCLV